MPIGPNPFSHDQKMAIANEIADQLTHHFGDRLVGLALYGSLASGLDGPYSDVEMFCVIDAAHYDQTLEWCTGAWKAEVNVISVKNLLRDAAFVNEKWPVIHTCFINTLPLFDPTNLFLHVRKTALAQPDIKFRNAVKNLIVEEIFEKIGKIRNAHTSSSLYALPSLVTALAYDAACLAGLANRHAFIQKSRMLLEVQTLPNIPQGLVPLCEAVILGDLSQPSHLVETCEAFWCGLIEWSQKQGYKLTSSLEELLARTAMGK